MKTDVRFRKLHANAGPGMLFLPVKQMKSVKTTVALGKFSESCSGASQMESVPAPSAPPAFHELLPCSEDLEKYRLLSGAIYFLETAWRSYFRYSRNV